MRVLITGGGGFIGSHLVDSQLAKGHFVRTVDLDTERLDHVGRHPQLDVVIGDITDQDLVGKLMNGIDLVYHLASAHLDVRLSDEQYRRVNVDATKNIVAAAHNAGAKQMIYCSTNGVVGEILSPPVDETVPCYPTNIYEQTKLQGEAAVLRFAEDKAFTVAVVRPAWVYGPRCPRTEKLLRNVKKRRFPMFGDGQTLRHPLFITDAVRGLELSAEAASSAGQVYFIAGEAPVTIEHLVNVIATLQGVRPPSLHLPINLGKLIGYGLQAAFRPIGKQPPFSRRSVDFYLKHNAYDISKAGRDLGFRPLVDLHEGLERTLSWHTNNIKSFYTEVKN